VRQIKKNLTFTSKMASVTSKKHPGMAQKANMLCSLSIFVIASATGLVRLVMAQEEPL
jgi:hypothetical protein